jgi:hypothetical protein
MKKIILAGKPKRDVPTSIKLSQDLKSSLDEVLPLRDLTLSSLLSDLLVKYLKENPLSPEEKRFLQYKKKNQQ